MSEEKKNNKNPAKAKDAETDSVFYAPKITREPASKQAELGKKLLLRISAKGQPKPDYQWFLNGKKISGARLDTLIIPHVRREHVGTYTCEAKNFVGFAMSKGAMITVLNRSLPELVLEPESAEVELGGSFRFSINTDFELLKDFTFQWLLNGKAIKGAVGPYISLKKINKKYQGEYTAIASKGEIVIESNTVKLIVRDKPNQKVVIDSKDEEDNFFMDPEDFS